MNTSVEVVLAILMMSSVIVLMLEAIGNKQTAGVLLEKPHIKLFSNGVILSSAAVLIFDLSNQNLLTQKPQLFYKSFAVLFLLINTFIAIHLGKKTKAFVQSGDFFFLLVSALTIAVANIWTDYACLKAIASVGWLLVMAALAVKTTMGGKKAEIGLKLTFSALLLLLLFIFSIYFLAPASLTSQLSNITLISAHTGLLGTMLLVLASMCLAGIAPFSFAHVDCADGSNLSTAFLLMSNAIIQGASHLLDAKGILERSAVEFSRYIEGIAFMLAAGLLITWLRALDQSRIRRTAVYVASSIGPIFCLSMLFGVSLLLPRLLFLLALFIFAGSALFALFGSMAYMDPLYNSWQTWEDIAGFGRKNRSPALYFLVALASIAGVPGTLGYFVKLSLIAPMKDSYIFNAVIFISIVMGAACTMRIFIFLFSKQSLSFEQPTIEAPPLSLMAACLILIVLGFFPFVR